MTDERKSHGFTRVEPILQHEGFAFTFALLYILSNVIFFLFGAAPEWRHFEGRSVVMRVVRASARGGGALINLNSALIIVVASRVFMTVLRRTPLNMVVPFDKAMPKFHSMIGITIFISTFLHAIPHLVNYGVNDLSVTGIHGHVSLAISGTALCIIIGAMRLTTTKMIRAYISYEAFYVTHIVGFVLYFGIIILHGSNHGTFSTYKFVTGPLVLYGIDIILRRFRNRGKHVLIPGDNAQTVGNNIVRLEMPRKFWYLPGQYCYMNIPTISRYQWHPFSMASSPHEGSIVFYVKVNGDWTQALYDICSNTCNPFYMSFNAYLRGPFGAPAQHVGQYEHVMLISGGVGATPFTSITKFAHYWIMNYTEWGRATAHSTDDAFKHYITVHSLPTQKESEWRSKLPQGQLTESVTTPPRGTQTQTRISMRKHSQTKRHKTWARFSVPKSLTKIFPPDFIPSLGDPNEPIPLRNSDRYLGDPRALISSRNRRPPRPVFTPSRNAESQSRGNSSTKDEKRMNSTLDFNFDEEDLTAAGVALEEEIILEQQQTASYQINNLGMDFERHAASRFIPAVHENFKATADGVSESASETGDGPVHRKERLLMYLHSVTANWVLLWIMMTRFAIVAIGLITHGFHLKQLGLSVYNNDVLNIIDLILSFILFLPVLTTVLTEMFMYGFHAFFRENVGNGFDLVVVAPLTLVCVVLHVLGLASVGEKVRHVPNIIVLGIWPVLSIFLLWRIIRTIGNRVALAQFMKTAIEQTKSLDFLRVNSTHKDDAWIVKELLPIATSGPVRIHRFLTRSDPVWEEWMDGYTKLPLQTTYHKPNWDKVFNTAVEKSKSGSVIGVFFCGPHRMARAIQEAAMKAMQRSINNAMDRRFNSRYSRKRMDDGIGRSPGLSDPTQNSGDVANEERASSFNGEALELANYGCNVRISVRVENFS